MSRERRREKCMLCGNPEPTGYAVIWKPGSLKSGWVCAAHRLEELVPAGTERFSVSIELGSPGEPVLMREPT